MHSIPWETLKKRIDDYIECSTCNINVDIKCYMVLDIFPPIYLFDYECKCGLKIKGELKSEIVK